MRTIVLPTDFSQTAWHAAEYAIKLFGPADRYVVQHSYHIPNAGSHVLVSLDDVLRKQAEQDMEEWLMKLRSELDNVPLHIESALFLGSVVNGVAAAVKGHKADLVVMGTIGAGGVMERWMGSNTAAVIREVHVPVVGVPHGAAARIPHHVAYACDMGQPAGVSDLLYQLAAGWGARVSEFHVDTSAPGMVAETPQGRARNTHVQTVESPSVIEGIDTYCRENQVEMLAMYPQKRGLLERLFHRSLSRKISMRLDIPLLILRNH